MAQETVIADVIKHETEYAILCVFGDDEVWLPKSQIEIDGGNDGWLGEVDVEITLPRWLLEEKEMEDYVIVGSHRRIT